MWIGPCVCVCLSVYVYKSVGDLCNICIFFHLPVFFCLFFFNFQQLVWVTGWGWGFGMAAAAVQKVSKDMSIEQALSVRQRSPPCRACLWKLLIQIAKPPQLALSPHERAVVLLRPDTHNPHPVPKDEPCTLQIRLTRLYLQSRRWCTIMIRRRSLREAHLLILEGLCVPVTLGAVVARAIAPCWVFQGVRSGGRMESHMNQPWRDPLNLAWSYEVRTLRRFPPYGNA